MALTLDSPVSEIPKIGPVLTKSFADDLNIYTVQDLLFYFPARYLDFTLKKNIVDLVAKDQVTIQGTINSISVRKSFKSRMMIVEAIVSDNTGLLKVVWFNQPYVMNQIKEGDTVVLSGVVEYYKDLQMTNPLYNQKDSTSSEDISLVPIYREKGKVTSRIVKQSISLCRDSIVKLHDPVPSKLLKKYKLVTLARAVELLHFPESLAETFIAQPRIALLDTLPQQLAITLQHELAEKDPAQSITVEVDDFKTLISKLPFTLTDSQKRAVWDIAQDLEKDAPMNRLLQGDVGSGKTIVAVMAMLQVARDGYQSALMAPTEILAHQHYLSISKLLEPFSIPVALLTQNHAMVGGLELEKDELLEKMQSGEVKIVIGTHSLIQSTIAFNHLALAIIDEQHRFGVGQRSTLKDIAQKQNISPHLLSISATPIPRTIALSLYGNLTISNLRQVPHNRKPIITKVVPEKGRKKTYEFIASEVSKGYQVYIVTPRLEDNSTSDIKSVKAEYKRLQEKIFPSLKLAVLHGKVPGNDKTSIMENFNKGKINILVATSVIEIGMDVSNATIMIIEGAERFGLSQLHQLRGRVGRGKAQSYCFLFTTEESQQENSRLASIAKTADGFALAEKDFTDRGFGDLLGTQQSGFKFRFPKFITIASLKTAHELTKDLFATAPQNTLITQARESTKFFHAE